MDQATPFEGLMRAYARVVLCGLMAAMVACHDGATTGAVPSPQTSTPGPRAETQHPLFQEQPLEYWVQVVKGERERDFHYVGGSRSAFFAMAAAFKRFGREGVDALVGILRGTDLAARRLAVLLLAQLGPEAEPAMPELVSALGEDSLSPDALQALCAIGPPSVQVFAETLGDDDAEVREMGATGLGRLGDLSIPAIPVLTRSAAQDPARDVRMASLRSLGALGPRAVDALPTMIAAICDFDEWVGRTAGDALPLICPDVDRVMPALLEALPSVRDPWAHGFREAVGRYGRAAVPYLLGFVLRSRGQERNHAVRALMDLREDAAEAVPGLVRLLDDPAIGTLAGHALSAIGTAAVGDLGVALDHEDARIRAQAASALGGIGPAAAQTAPRLIELLQDPDPGVRASAAEGLGKIHALPRAAMPPLRGLLSDGDKNVRRAALAAAIRLDPTAVDLIPMLQAEWQTHDLGFQWSVASSLRFMRGAAVEAVPFIVDALGDSTAHVNAREVLCLALAAMGAGAREAIPALEAALNDPRGGVRHHAGIALQIVQEAVARQERGDEDVDPWDRDPSRTMSGAELQAMSDAASQFEYRTFRPAVTFLSAWMLSRWFGHEDRLDLLRSRAEAAGEPGAARLLVQGIAFVQTRGAVDVLVALLGSEQAAVRSEASYFVGMMAGSLGPDLSCLADDGAAVASREQAIQEVLTWWREARPGFEPAVRRRVGELWRAVDTGLASGDPRRAADAVQELGAHFASPGMIGRLDRIVQEGEAEVGTAALHVLGGIPDPRAVDVILRSALSHSNHAIRAEARLGLRALAGWRLDACFEPGGEPGRAPAAFHAWWRSHREVFHLDWRRMAADWGT